MGFLDICRGKELLKYGTKNSTGCDCVSNKDPANIYTDGSLNPKTGQGGYGVYSPGLGMNIAKPYPYSEHKNNVLTLESKAILEAVTDAKKNHKTRNRVDIFSDSEDALTRLQVLKNGERPLPGDNDNGLGERILKEVKNDDWKTEVHMHKVKAHSQIQGNEVADRYAKAGARNAPVIDPSLLPKPVRKVDDEIYYSSNSFSSCNKKRSRLNSERSSVSQNPPCPIKFPRRSVVSPSSPAAAGKRNADRDCSTKPAPASRGFFGGFFKSR